MAYLVEKVESESYATAGTGGRPWRWTSVNATSPVAATITPVVSGRTAALPLLNITPIQVPHRKAAAAKMKPPSAEAAPAWQRKKSFS